LSPPDRRVSDLFPIPDWPARPPNIYESADPAGGIPDAPCRGRQRGAQSYGACPLPPGSLARGLQALRAPRTRSRPAARRSPATRTREPRACTFGQVMVYAACARGRPASDLVRRVAVQRSGHGSRRGQDMPQATGTPSLRLPRCGRQSMPHSLRAAPIHRPNDLWSCPPAGVFPSGSLQSKSGYPGPISGIDTAQLPRLSIPCSSSLRSGRRGIPPRGHGEP